MSEDQETRNMVPAILEGSTVLATGPIAISLHNKGYYGIPEHEGVKLNGFEALHLLELGRIKIKKDDEYLTEENVLSFFSDILPQFTLRYLVYKDLRNRGYILNLGSGSSFFFRLYARNTKPKLDGAKYYVTCLREGGSIQLNDLESLIEIARKSSKLLIIGMVDAIGDVSYLEATKIKPSELDDKIYSNFSDWNWKELWDEYSKLEKSEI
ncbi:MAG: tRNA-splicing endonuclease [Candidatus Heimdallarchaeota archaeon LC_2]|nr:MAG: tRNA-splicing endonuclease [Candidatus Heimdallarchaeota archaeon LC_2]